MTRDERNEVREFLWVVLRDRKLPVADRLTAVRLLVSLGEAERGRSLDHAPQPVEAPLHLLRSRRQS
jgi:hypothetical protein